MTTNLDFPLAGKDLCREFGAVITPGAVIASVLPVYLLLIAGAVLRRTGVLPREVDAGVMRLVLSVMLPCFILDKILGSAVLRSGSVVAWGLFLGFFLIMVGIGIGWVVGRGMGLERGMGARTFALSAGCQNFGFTAVPVVEILWGGSGALALLFVHNIGVELAMWSVGVMMMSGGPVKWKRLINGVTVAVAIGLGLVALGLDGHVTGPGRTALSMMGIGAFPVAILISGCSMMDLAGAERPDARVLVGGALVRLALAPAAILCAAKFLPLPVELRQVLVVQAAMPAGMSAILLAKMYGGRPAVAVQVVIATTLLSLVTLPWIIAWGCAWIGLKPLLP